MLRTLSRPLASLRSSPLATTPCRRGFITIVQQGSVAYRLTLGKSPVELLPGLSICIPILQTVQHVDMRERSIALDSLHAFTSDNVPVVVSGSFFYRVIDAKKACFEVQDYVSNTQAIGTSALRSSVGRFAYDTIIGDRNLLNATLRETIGDSVAAWGIDATKFEVQQFQPANRDVEKQLEQQMEAERNRRKQLLDTQAAVNVAEGMKQRTILNSEGELQAKINQADGDFAATLKSGEALAAQISSIATGLAAATSSTPTDAHLAKAAHIIVELRRLDMLKAVSTGPGSHTYFLNESLGAPRTQFELDTSEKWKQSIEASQAAARMSGGGQ